MKFTMLFLANFLLIFFLYLKSLKFPLPTKFLIQILCGYLALEYLVRPPLLYYANSKNIRLTFSDIRLVNDQTHFLNAYSLCVIGNFALVSTVILVGQKFSKDFTLPNMQNDAEIISLVSFGLIIGFLSIFIESSNFQNPISKSLTTLGHITYCLYLWKRPDMAIIFDKSKTLVIHIFGIMSIFTLYFFTDYSKGPLFVPLIIYVYRSRIWKKKFDPLRFTAISFLLIFSVLSSFNKLQGRYLGEGYRASMADSAGKLPWYIDWMRPIANRFDLFTSVSDAYFAEKGALGGFKEFMEFVTDSLFWNPSSGRTAQTYGQVWNQRVTSISLPDSKLSPVSLAQGPTADGWVWFGMEGIILANLVLAISVLILGRLLTSGTLSSVFVMTIVGSNVFFEAGIIQLARLLNLGVKVFLVAWLFLILHRFSQKLRYV